MSITYKEDTQADFLTGTLSNVTAQAAGSLTLSLINRGIYMNQGYVNIPDDLNITTFPVTVEMWFKGLRTSAVQFLMDTRTASATSRVWIGLDNGNNLEVGINGAGVDFRTPAQWVDDTLYYLAIVFQAENTLVYWDGALISTLAAVTAGNLAFLDNIKIGSRFNVVDVWQGDVVDSIRIWNRALSAGEISGVFAAPQTIPTTTDLVAWYPCDETSGYTLTDYSGNGYDADITSLVTRVADGPVSYATEGFRLSPAISINTITDYAASKIQWTDTVTGDESIRLYGSLDQATWWELYDGEEFTPNLLALNQTYAGQSLFLKEVLTTPTPATTPTLSFVRLDVYNEADAQVRSYNTSFSVTLASDDSTKVMFPICEVLRSDGVTWFDVTDWLVSCDINLGDVASVGTGNTGADSVARNATFVIHSTTKDNFAPLDQTSPINIVSATYDPLLFPNRMIRLRMALAGPGATPSANDFYEMFRGYLGDEIDSQGEMVFLEVRDLSKRLQDFYILDPITVPEGTQVSVAIQTVLDACFGAGVIPLYVIDEPPYPVAETTCQYQSAWDAIQQFANTAGFFCGYRWYSGTKEQSLVLLEPPRSKDESSGNNWRMDWTDDYLVSNLSITDKDIRNRLYVYYRRLATSVTPPVRVRDVVLVEDSTSITNFGIRPAQIEEADTSPIQTQEQALAFANAVLDDLSELSSTTQIEMPLMPWMEVFDGLVMTDPRHSSTDEFFGVDSVRHQMDFSANKYRTTVTGAGRVIGGKRKWLDVQSRPGAKPPVQQGNVAPEQIITDRVDPNAITTNSFFQFVDDTGGFQLSAAQTTPVAMGTTQISFELTEVTDCMLYFSGTHRFQSTNVLQRLAATIFMSISTNGGAFVRIGNTTRTEGLRNDNFTNAATYNFYGQDGIVVFQTLTPGEYTVRMECQTNIALGDSTAFPNAELTWNQRALGVLILKR